MNQLWCPAIAVAMSIPGIALGQYRTEVVHAPGRISGRVTFAGSPTKLPPETRDKNPEVCGSTHENETLLVGPQGGLANVVVHLENVQAGKAMAPMVADLDQTGCTYVPHVQAVPVGSTLNLLNSDPLLHNIHAVEAGSTVFNYAMPRSVRKIPKRLLKPGFLTIKCDVHAWMNGVVAVLDNPYFAVTDANGDFAFGDVPPGTYTLAAWHEKLGEKTQQVTVGPNASVKARFTFGGP